MKSRCLLLLIGAFVLLVSANLTQGQESKSVPAEWSPQIVRCLIGHKTEITAVSISPDAQIVASASKDGLLRLWDVKSGQSQELTGHKGEVLSIAFAPNGRQLATCSSSNVGVWGPGGVLKGTKAAGEVLLWDLTKNTLERRIDIEDDTVVSVEYSRDGLHLACGCGDRKLRFFDPRTGKTERTVSTAHANPVQAYSLLHGWKSVASASTRVGGVHEVKVWDLPEGVLKQTLTWETTPSGGWVRAFAGGLYYLNQATIYCWGDDKTVKVFNVESGQIKYSMKGHEGIINDAAFSDDGQWMATASDDGSVKVWSTDSHSSGVTLRGHKGKVACVAMSSDGRILASGGEDMIVALWNNAQSNK